MELIKRVPKRQILIAKCEKCGKEHDILYKNTIKPHMPFIELRSVIHCECGEYHNLVVEQKANQTKAYTPAQQNDEPLECPRCHSTQLHAGSKGFSLGKAAAGGILVGGVGLLGGLIGSKKIMITCLKCGYKWQAGKR